MRVALLLLPLLLAACSGNPDLDRARLGAAMAAAGEGMSGYGQRLAANQPVRMQTNCTSSAVGGTVYTNCR